MCALAERLSQSEIVLPLRKTCYYSPLAEVGVFSTEIKIYHFMPSTAGTFSDTDLQRSDHPAFPGFWSGCSGSRAGFHWPLPPASALFSHPEKFRCILLFKFRKVVVIAFQHRQLADRLHLLLLRNRKHRRLCLAAGSGQKQQGRHAGCRYTLFFHRAHLIPPPACIPGTAARSAGGSGLPPHSPHSLGQVPKLPHCCRIHDLHPPGRPCRPARSRRMYWPFCC